MSTPKGYKMKQESKDKISKALKGRMPKNLSLINANKNGSGNPMYGKKGSEKQKEAVRLAMLKRDYRDPEYRKKISEKQKGEKGSNWKGGISPINKLIRRSVEFRLWREAVFERDNWTCLWCKKRGGELHPDHIKPFSLFPELRFAIDNGRTLCRKCHMTTDTWGGKMKKYETNK